MTDPVDPFQPLIDEVRDMRHAFEEGIGAVLSTSTEVVRLRTDLAATDGRATRRARWFRGMWVALLAASVVFFVVGRVDSNHANRSEACFERWSNATSTRTQTLNTASNTRIEALDHLLDVRTHYGPDAPQAKQATAEASTAGDAYEQIAAANPPIPPEQVFCAHGQQPQPTTTETP